MPRAPRALAWYLPPLLLAVSPIAVVVGANLGVVPLRGVVVARAIAVATGATLLVLWALRAAQRDLAARAAWLSWFLILCSLYWPSARALMSAGLLSSERDWMFAAPYVVSMAAAAALASRPWENRPREPGPFLATGALLVFAALAPAAAARPVNPRWQPAADALIAAPLSHAGGARPVPARDVYYIVLDGLGRPDTVEDAFGVDLGPFADALRAKGFRVPERARTNYSQTDLLLASTLNMSYLDAMVRVTGTRTKNRTPLHYLIQQNALMRLASRAGYEVVALGSNFRSTKDFAVADACRCARSALDELELAVIGLTPLAALRPPRWAEPYAMHRRVIERQFEGLRTHTRGTKPAFVFAHVLAPHPPFVFTRDGTPIRSGRLFTIADGKGFGGTTQEYATQYAGQAEYTLRRVMAAVEALLQRPGPAPVIVVHGDHGPQLWDTAREDMIRTRMGIFAAYYFPGAPVSPYPTMTPVNGARMLARYFGAELPLLGDDSFFAEWNTPYAFVKLASEEAGGERARELHERDSDGDAAGTGQERRPE